MKVFPVWQRAHATYLPAALKVFPVAWPIDQQVPTLVKVFFVPRDMSVASASHIAKDDRSSLRVLMSYVYDETRAFPRLAAEAGAPVEHLDMMLDSGAFSVWTQGTTIELDTYAAWASAYIAEVPRARVVNLDVIPGEPGGRPSKAEREAAVKGSLENADRLRAAGLPLVEVYHWHEPFSALDEIISRRRRDEIIGFGGLAGPGDQAAKIEFLDGCFAHLRDFSGWDKLVPAHGFGISPESPLARRYPWYSIDSSSWLKPVRFHHGVDRRGKTTGGDQRMNVGDRGEAARSLSSIYLQRVLRRWRRLEESYTTLWEERGISFDLKETP